MGTLSNFVDYLWLVVKILFLLLLIYAIFSSFITTAKKRKREEEIDNMLKELFDKVKDNKNGIILKAEDIVDIDDLENIKNKEDK